MKPVLKRLLQQFSHVAPGIVDRVRASRQRRQIRRFEHQLGLPEIAQSFVDRHGLHVLHGPFQGMNYVPRAAGSAFVPKLLGSYELELHDVLSAVLTSDVTAVVDIGCAEGYYAVGLARSLRQVHVHAFDTDAEGRELCAAMARGNAVADRVLIYEKCDARQLNTILEGKIKGEVLVICDCEGCEYDLLRPDLVPSLRLAHLLVELHAVEPRESTNSTVPQSFLNRFSETHDIKLIMAEGRNPDSYQELNFLPVQHRQIAIGEFRHDGQQWAFMRAR